jgi:cell division protease FtsH
MSERAATVGGTLAGAARWVWRRTIRDPLATFLLAASIGLGAAFFLLLGSLAPRSSGQRVGLSEVISLAQHKQMRTATLLDQDARVVVLTNANRTLWAAYPSSNAETSSLVRQLATGGAYVVVDQQSGKPAREILVQFLLPVLILVCLFAFFTRLGDEDGSGGFAAFSQWTGRAFGRKKRPRPITFADVAGADEAVAELREIRDYLAHPERYARVGARAPKGVLLVGPPGTGKTLLAKATSGEAEAAFFSLSGSEFVESLVGVGAARVRDLFAKARKAAPAIIFIDELDAAGRKRGAGLGQGNDEREQTLNQLLVEMDGFGGDAGLVVMGATNRPDILDPALLRPGRFDRTVTVEAPDVHGRLEILGLYAARHPLSDDVSLPEIARLTPGFTGAELENVVNEAALLTVREDEPTLEHWSLEEAIDRVAAGPATRHVLTETEKWTIAVHEASHAVVARALDQTIAGQKLSIVARGRQLGTAARMLRDRDALVRRRSDLQRELVTIVAGAAGESVAFGEISTGASDDLHAATSLARSLVTSFGMSDVLGPVTIAEGGGEVFLGASLQDLGSVGPATLDLVDAEVERFVGEAELGARSVLERNWNAVTETAGALLEHETLSGVALDAVLSTVGATTLDQLPSTPAVRRYPLGGA